MKQTEDFCIALWASFRPWQIGEMYFHESGFENGWRHLRGRIAFLYVPRQRNWLGRCIFSALAEWLRAGGFRETPQKRQRLLSILHKLYSWLVTRNLGMVAVVDRKVPLGHKTDDFLRTFWKVYSRTNLTISRNAFWRGSDFPIRKRLDRNW